MSENEKPLSRAEYKRQQQNEENELKERDKKRLKAERDYAATHPQNNPEPEEAPTRSRKGRTVPISGEDKSRKMKSKLNIAIVGLVIAIVAVYLVLFFVG